MLNEYDVCVVGMGPAWLGLVSQIKEKMENRLICFEAGEEIENRKCQYLSLNNCSACDTCHMIMGVGGCSVLSSGKISGYPAGSKMKTIIGNENETRELIQQSLEYLKKKINLKKVDVNLGAIQSRTQIFARENMVFKYYDVYKFDHCDLKNLFAKERKRVEELGANICTNEKVLEIKKKIDFFEVTTSKRKILAKKVVLAVGKSGEQLVHQILNEEYAVAKENFIDIGVRIECPDAYLSQISDLHGDIKLKYGDSRTYCYSEKGKVAGYRLNNHLFTEGYSDLVFDSGLTNFAILTRLNKDNINYSSILKWYNNNVESLISKIPMKDFMERNNKQLPIVYSETIIANLREMCEKFLKVMLKEQDYSNIHIYGPEMDIVPYKLECDHCFSVGKNLYAIGACCGYFRGILQSYSSGVKCASKIMEE